MQTTAGKVAEIALSSIGLKMAGDPTASGKETVIPLRIDAAGDLNASTSGQGLTVVVRLYKLRDQNAFLGMPYASAGTTDKEKQTLGGDLLEVQEVVLSPGQKLILQERMPGDAAYLGVATLFRSPYPKRWRFAFATAEAGRSGVTVGIHACAMTSTSTPPVGMTAGDAALLSSVRCD